MIDKGAFTFPGLTVLPGAQGGETGAALQATGTDEMAAREAYQQTLDSIFGYIILAICVLAVLGVIFRFGSIAVSTGGGSSGSSRSGGSGGSSGGGGASGGW